MLFNNDFPRLQTDVGSRAGPGTYLPLISNVPNGSLCQQLTFGDHQGDLRQLSKPVAGIMRDDGSTGSSVAAVTDQLSLDRSLFSRMLSYT